MRSPLSSVFSPHSVEPERLEQLFIGRDRLLGELLDDLGRTVQSGSGRYEALVGPRGIGKSHVMALLKHRIGLDDRLAPRVAMAWLGEEEHVNSLVALLARVLGALDSGSTDTSDQVVRLRRTPASDQEELAVSMLEQQTGDRALVLMVENLDDLLDALGRQAQQKLRNLLQSHPSWNVVATSCTWSAALANKGSPLYGSFVRRSLEPLTAELCHSMLVRLAQVHGHDDFLAELRGPRGMPRIRAIHHVVGGAPRAMAQLYPHLQRRTLEDLEGAFFELAEELTPYLQEQMRRRPAGQRPVLEALAESWRPLSVGELAERTFNTHQTTSGYLRYLNQDRLVLRYGVGREAFYSLAEPLFRIARSMKRPDGLAEAFVRCVAGWFTEEEVEQPLQGLPGLGVGDSTDGREDDGGLSGLRALAVWLSLLRTARADPAPWLPVLVSRSTGALPSAALLEASRLLPHPTQLAELAELLERLQALPEGPGDLAMPLALTQLPRSPRAFGRLAPPERALVRDAIRLHHGPGCHWLRDLPPEPS